MQTVSMLLPANKKQTINWRLNIMKRMIDGIIDVQITQGDYVCGSDTSASISFYFPYGYWPLSLISEPFSILPGRIDWGDSETNLAGVCFPARTRYFDTVVFNSGGINITNEGKQTPNYITYNFTFPNKANRDAFIKELFGATATPTIGETKFEEFATSVYALLARVGGATQEY